jgi:hypothetical protein
MPVQATTQITAFRFATIATDTLTCESDIRAGRVALAYKLQGMQQVAINTAPGGPIPPPPAPEPPAPPGQDPVRLLVQNGWKVTDFVLTAAGANTGQPAGFGIGQPYNGGPPQGPGFPGIANPVFERLELEFAFPMFCRCAATGKCIARNFKLSVKYDGTSHPVSTVEASNEGPCINVAALMLNQEIGLPQTMLLNDKATYTFASGVTCDCSKHDDDKKKKKAGKKESQHKIESTEKLGKKGRSKGDDDGNGGGDGAAQAECPIQFVVEYVFRTVL